MAQPSNLAASRRRAIRHAGQLIGDVCEVAGNPSLIDEARAELAKAGVLKAIQRRDTAVLFDWLIDVISYQGISDAAAFTFMETHGRATYELLSASLVSPPKCTKLQSWWHFEDCGFRKIARTCNEPRLLSRCPLPRLPLRNGNLNRAAYSLFLFLRDVCGGDFVGWLDSCLGGADDPASRNRGELMAAAAIEPLRHVYGVSDKLINMSISMLLLAGGPQRERWVTAGASMIAIDTLVHAWMMRTGILKRLGVEHSYGPRCYGKYGCAALIRRVSASLDATRFNPKFPRDFPRFVQHAIWRFCAQSGMAQCNGYTVPDGTACFDITCPVFALCDRVVQPRAP
jgi:hypothetical protein